jgi:hypothetical protein
MIEGSGTENISVGEIRRELGGRAPLMGTQKDLLSKALEMSVSFHKDPVLRNTRRRSFPMALVRRMKFIVAEELL